MGRGEPSLEKVKVVLFQRRIGLMLLTGHSAAHEQWAGFHNILLIINFAPAELLFLGYFKHRAL
jgi:hypothetical protein